MTVEIRIADTDNEEEWDAIVSQSSLGTLFHAWKWLKITEKHTDTKLYPLIGVKNNIPVGVIPLFFKKKGPVRMIFSPPPHVSLPYLGPVLAEYDRLKQEKREQNYVHFQNAVECFINNNLKAHYISISLPPSLQDPRPFAWAGYTIEPDYDYSVDVSIGTENLHNSLDRYKRRGLRKAKDMGMVFEPGTRKDCEKILDLMDWRYAQQRKILTASKEYFLDILDNYKDTIKIFSVIVEHETVTGIICFPYRDSLYAWFGYAKPKNPIYPSPNEFLHGEMVRYAFEHGFHYYTIIGAAGDKRLHEFYAARFNPALKPRYGAIKNRSCQE